MGLKSHSLQLDPNIPPGSAAQAPTRAGCAQAPFWLVPGKHYNVSITTHAAWLQLRDMVEGSDTSDGTGTKR